MNLSQVPSPKSIIELPDSSQNLTLIQPRKHSHIPPQPQVKRGANKKVNPDNHAKLDIFSSLRLKNYTKLMMNYVKSRRVLKNIHYQVIGDLSVANVRTSIDLNGEDENQSLYEEIQHKIGDFFQTYKCPSFLTIPVFNEIHPLKMIWNYIMMITMCQFFFFLPLSFLTDILQFDLDYLMTKPNKLVCLIIIGCNIPIKANSGFYEKGEYKDNRIEVLKNFCQKHMLVDIGMILILIFESQIWKGFLLLQVVFIKINRLKITYFYQIIIFQQLVQRIEESLQFNNKNVNLIKLIKLLCTVLFVNHIFACIWMFIANQKGEDERSFIELKQIPYDTWHGKYLQCYYYVMVTMCTVGYGDFSPQNTVEIIVSIITMLITCGVFAFCINIIGGILEDILNTEREINKKIIAINNYMKRKKITTDLQFKIRQYLTHVWKNEKEDNNYENSLIDDLSPNLKKQLKIEAFKNIITTSPVFTDNFSQESRHQFINIIQEVLVGPGQIIQQNNDFNLYFIEQGKIEIVIEEARNNNKKITYRSLYELGKERYFGHKSFFTAQNDNLMYRSLDFTKLLVISREDFLSIIQRFPKDYEKFQYLKDIVLYNSDYKLISQKCSICQLPNHTILRCEHAHYLPDKYKQIKLEQSEVQKREEYIRSKQDKFKNWINIVDCVQDAIDVFQDNETFILESSWVMMDPEFSSEDEFQKDQDQQDEEYEEAKDEKEKKLNLFGDLFKKKDTQIIKDDNKILPDNINIQSFPQVIEEDDREQSEQSFNKSIDTSRHKNEVNTSALHKVEDVSKSEDNLSVSQSKISSKILEEQNNNNVNNSISGTNLNASESSIANFESANKVNESIPSQNPKEVQGNIDLKNITGHMNDSISYSNFIQTLTLQGENVVNSENNSNVCQNLDMDTIQVTPNDSMTKNNGKSKKQTMQTINQLKDSTSPKSGKDYPILQNTFFHKNEAQNSLVVNYNPPEPQTTPKSFYRSKTKQATQNM